MEVIGERHKPYNKPKANCKDRDPPYLAGLYGARGGRLAFALWKENYALRSQTIERVFAGTKEKKACVIRHIELRLRLPPGRSSNLPR